MTPSTHKAKSLVSMYQEVKTLLRRYFVAARVRLRFLVCDVIEVEDEGRRVGVMGFRRNKTRLQKKK
jgi:hypothetical protein